MERYDVVPAPWGDIFMVFTERGITRLCLTEQRFREEYGEGLPRQMHGEAQRQLGGYFAGRRQQFTLPLAMRGTPFQGRVWQALLAIPYGQTRPYGWVAERIGVPGAGRAVGNAVGANPIPIVVPCHRVVRGDGSLGGYHYGPEMKRRLLDLEAGKQL
ncbi:MAG: methylated-DNA--[protein]-cysteine S-methyltransferase [Candidatus Thermoplasmatota archaeon]|nr:methylated-DNA--[protein]-cysteine S-methyltransferase [Candidatus Thermoplasmatota archaeon]